MAKNLKSKVTNKEQVMFVRRALRIKITDFQQQRIDSCGFKGNDTLACNALGKQIGLSGATLLKVFSGEFTFRTVQKMATARWFLISDFIAAKVQPQSPQHDSKTRTTQSARGEWSRGYDQGRADGVRAGKQAAKAAVQGALQAAYDQGYNEGKRDGKSEARIQNNIRNQNRTANATNVPIDRLRVLFNMNESRGAVQGEVVAARKAAGKTLARWIREQFGEDVEVNVQ